MEHAWLVFHEVDLLSANYNKRKEKKIPMMIIRSYERVNLGQNLSPDFGNMCKL